jgi:hypothetical protein
LPDAPDVRSITTLVEETYHERGPRPARPLRRGAVAAVIRNPFAGRFEPGIVAFADALVPLATSMAERLLASLGGEPALIEAYGKGAIVGEDGELEHAALWHVPAGTAMRRVLGGGKAIMPSTKKVAGIGARIDVPLHHKDAAYVRSHFSALEVGVPDAPRRDEILLVLAVATGGRIHARVGGLSAGEIRGEDGLR